MHRAQLIKDIHSTLKTLERLVRKVGDIESGNCLKDILGSSDYLRSLQDILTGRLKQIPKQRKRRKHTESSQYRAFFESYRDQDGTKLSKKAVDDLLSVTANWRLDDEEIEILEACCDLWIIKPDIFFDGDKVDGDTIDRCVSDIERITNLFPTIRKVIMIILSEEVQKEQERLVNEESKSRKRKARKEGSRHGNRNRGNRYLVHALRNLTERRWTTLSDDVRDKKKSILSRHSAWGWKWRRLCLDPMILSLTKAKAERFEKRGFEDIEFGALNAFLRTLPQYRIFPRLKLAWTSISCRYRGRRSQMLRIQSTPAPGGLSTIHTQSASPQGTSRSQDPGCNPEDASAVVIANYHPDTSSGRATAGGDQSPPDIQAAETLSTLSTQEFPTTYGSGRAALFVEPVGDFQVPCDFNTSNQHTSVPHDSVPQLPITVSTEGSQSSFQSRDGFSHPPRPSHTVRSYGPPQERHVSPCSTVPQTIPDQTTPAFPENFMNNSNSTIRQNQTVINASLQGVSDVFGEYMCRAIRRVPASSDGTPSWKAAVTMEFPDFVLVDCVMMLEVSEGEVERLVRDLFGIVVESVMGVRHLLLGEGVRLTSNTSNPEITLKGVRDETILYVFGPDIYRAIRASKMYKRESQEKRNSATECVSMIFTSKSGEGAYINLCLDLKGGLEIRDKLYH